MPAHTPADGSPVAPSDEADQAAGPGRTVLDARDIARALTRIAHEILERNKGTADLVLAHFLTSFVDRLRLFRVARRAVRAGGAISVTSTTREAMFRVRQGVAALLGDAALVDAAAPAPPRRSRRRRRRPP